MQTLSSATRFIVRAKTDVYFIMYGLLRFYLQILKLIKTNSVVSSKLVHINGLKKLLKRSAIFDVGSGIRGYFFSIYIYILYYT